MSIFKVTHVILTKATMCVNRARKQKTREFHTEIFSVLF